jgi:WD40 repeat protein
VSELGCARLDRDASFCGGVAWDPHHPSEVAVAADGEVVVWDVKSGDRARAVGEAVEGSSGGVVRALSYNTNKPWMLATAGDDYRVKLWDLRKCAAPVKILDGHTHW